MIFPPMVVQSLTDCEISRFDMRRSSIEAMVARTSCRRNRGCYTADRAVPHGVKGRTGTSGHTPAYMPEQHLRSFHECDSSNPDLLVPAHAGRTSERTGNSIRQPDGSL